MGKNINLVGQKFNRLLVIKNANMYDNNGNKLWLCQCDCGNVAIVTTYALRHGRKKSCGCAKEEASKKMILNSTTHNETKTRLYSIWHTIKQRCHYPKHISYSQYGERGIVVCEEWRNSYEAFRNWALSNGYDESAPRGKCSIDRIDVNGNYCPENCRWISYKEQANNKRTNRLITFGKKTNTLSEWSEITGIKYSTISERLRMGWPAEKALTTKPRRYVREH